MRLPRRFLDTTATVLSGVKTGPDRLGQYTTTWEATGQPIPAAHFPAGERITTQAQLKGVKVAREAYLQGSIDLNPQTHRLRLDGQDYAITLVNEWPGFTVAGLVSV
ncbi:hypothetical protein [Deinococcus daejeonensis]|uniref:Phage head-tail adaptor n=1 Tax=Deinococcus daejeonensis TaxID=1007098 RepID=A0ABQ2IZ14_9DEIO|nr:hypothetical protein [Deinococcus daejeonensis]GGN32277.1 hypothetical protein GCM10010842_08830 [Deinococcus daejeonensis]